MCLCCHRVFDSDYRKKHNHTYHENLVKQQKQIDYQAVVAFDNSFQAIMLEKFKKKFKLYLKRNCITQ